MVGTSPSHGTVGSIFARCALERLCPDLFPDGGFTYRLFDRKGVILFYIRDILHSIVFPKNNTSDTYIAWFGSQNHVVDYVCLDVVLPSWGLWTNDDDMIIYRRSLSR